MISKWTVIAPAVLVVSGLIWAADFITLQGERKLDTEARNPRFCRA